MFHVKHCTKTKKMFHVKQRGNCFTWNIGKAHWSRFTGSYRVNARVRSSHARLGREQDRHSLS